VSAIHSLFQSPIDASHLTIVNNNIIDAQGNVVSNIHNNLIYLLAVNESDTTTAWHQDANTHFDYITHYHQDAIEVDYFHEYVDPETEHENHRIHQIIWSKIKSKKGIILDVGCGRAWVAQHALPLGYDVVSMDITPINVNKAIQKYPHQNHYGLVADVFSLPIRDNSVDVIIASEIIEHVFDPDLFLHKLITALKPGGQLIVTTPYNECIEYSLCIHCNHKTPHNAHIHSFTLERVEAVMQKLASTHKYTSTFANKLLIKMRTGKFFKYLSYPLWRLIDRLSLFFIYKPKRWLWVIEK